MCCFFSDETKFNKNDIQVFCESLRCNERAKHQQCDQDFSFLFDNVIVFKYNPVLVTVVQQNN